MLPYDTKYFYEAISPGDIIPQPPKMKIPPGRHDARGSDIRHMPCNLTKSMKPQLKPLKRKIMEKAMQMRQEAIQKAELTALTQGETKVKKSESEESEEGFFLTEPKQSLMKKPEVKEDIVKKKVSIKDSEKSTKKETKEFE
ncbi:hypothetical protein KUTeg_005006 [Tegillarca granosa]|uniref:Uncharacterized protein n=1 Tax=Tegillarca granosa TaxID=220873 RepID=A0ABQ9FKJ9_TEGGR|nr:hypothetical protein KUTeg_005006 [Tegillarca granosa]